MHTTITPSNSRSVASGFMTSPNLSRQVMSSREIAELVSSRHDDVKRSIDRLVLRGTIVQPPLADEQIPDSVGRLRKTQVYQICKRDTYIIVAQLSPEFTAALVDRWQELEEQAAGQFSVPTTLSEALRLAADQAEENQKLHLVIREQAPKVAAIKRLAAAGGAICITDAAKQLQLKPAQLFAWLEQHRWIFRRAGSARWVAYQPRITAGLLMHKVTELKPDLETGLERVAYQPLVTPKGLARLAELINGVAA